MRAVRDRLRLARGLSGAGAALLLALAAQAVPAAVDSIPPSPWRTVQQGIAVELAIQPVEPGGGALREGQDVAVRLSLSDTATGQPLSRLDPAAWMVLLPEGKAAGPDTTCTERVEELVSGGLLSRPELDLNVYFVLAMNQDATVSVVDPLFGFGGTKLLAMLSLQSPGEDWALTADQKRLFISQPDAGRVAVADTAGWKVTDQLDAGLRPTRLALQPDGAYLWAGLDAAAPEGSGVAVIDARTLAVAARIPTGRGHHEIAFTADDTFAFVTNAGDGTVSVIDVRRLAKVKDVKTGTKPVSIDYSSLADAVYVTDETEGTIVAVGGRSHEVIARMTARPGLGQIRFAPGSRFGFAVNPEADALSVVDASRNRIVQTGEMLDGPDQVSFSDDLAYIRHRGSETVLMVPLKEIGEEGRTVPVVDFPGGEKPFGRGIRPSLAPGIVRSPETSAVLVANPADQVIYYYKEGMAAPMGAFRNYDREPRAVLVVDRSLRERGRPGTYETTTQLRRPGRYQVAVFLDAPRIVHCFDAQVLADPVMEARRREVQPAEVTWVGSAAATAGDPVLLRVRLTDPRTGKPATGLTDVVVMTYPASGLWQKRQSAREIGDGIYEVSFVPPSADLYSARVACPSQHLDFYQARQLNFQAAAGALPRPTLTPTLSHPHSRSARERAPPPRATHKVAPYANWADPVGAGLVPALFRSPSPGRA
ncbi:MAG TPA: YncE family protein [Thermoanaerobaculia bacterium]|nr:YncE family protein [Thermoanaerobaculia bacterium]